MNTPDLATATTKWETRTTKIKLIAVNLNGSKLTFDAGALLLQQLHQTHQRTRPRSPRLFWEFEHGLILTQKKDSGQGQCHETFRHLGRIFRTPKKFRRQSLNSTGMRTVMVVPKPRRLERVIVPLSRSTACLTMAKPKPVPRMRLSPVFEVFAW